MKKSIMLAITMMMAPLTLWAEPERGQVAGDDTTRESRELYHNKRFTIGVHTRLANGVANELVYIGSHKLSELIWDIKNVYMFGGNASALIWPSWGLKLNADVSSMVNKQGSTMDDYDWMVAGLPWTHWSHHENTTLERAFAVDVSLSKSIASDDAGSFNLDVELGFKRESWGWIASGGTFIYSTITFRDTVGTFANVPGVSYEQTINTPYLGASMSYRESDFSLFLRIAGSPFVFADAVDNHYLRSLTVTDKFVAGKMIDVDLRCDYHVNDAFVVSLSYSYQKYYENRGDARYNYYGTGVQLYGPDYAGMALEYETVGLNATYAF